MTSDDFRKLALAVPTAVELSHMNHPDFRVEGRIFASLGSPDEHWGMVKLTPEQQSTFIMKAPKSFRPCSGAWGRQGCTNVHLSSVKANVVRAALELAAKNVRPLNSARSRLNREWHEANRMPKCPTIEQRIAWHLAHVKACACRPIPASVLQAIAAKKKNA